MQPRERLAPILRVLQLERQPAPLPVSTGSLVLGAGSTAAPAVQGGCIMKKIWKLLIPTLLLGAVPALQADPPVCQVFCVYSTCQKNSDCTAMPGGTCNLACPKTGCCVYP